MGIILKPQAGSAWSVAGQPAYGASLILSLMSLTPQRSKTRPPRGAAGRGQLERFRPGGEVSLSLHRSGPYGWIPCLVSACSLERLESRAEKLP